MHDMLIKSTLDKVWWKISAWTCISQAAGNQVVFIFVLEGFIFIALLLMLGLCPPWKPLEELKRSPGKVSGRLFKLSVESLSIAKGSLSFRVRYPDSIEPQRWLSHVETCSFKPCVKIHTWIFMVLGSNKASALINWDLPSTCDWAQMRCVLVQPAHGLCGALLPWCMPWYLSLDNLDGFKPEIFAKWDLNALIFGFKYRTLRLNCRPIATAFLQILEIHVFHLHPSYIHVCVSVL